MSIQGVWQKSFGFLRSKPVVVEAAAGELTSDAGLLPIRQFDAQIGLTAELAEAISGCNRRYEPCVDHKLNAMVRCRIYGILADYSDQNDHDVLRTDPVFKLLAGRRATRMTDIAREGLSTHSATPKANGEPGPRVQCHRGWFLDVSQA